MQHMTRRKWIVGVGLFATMALAPIVRAQTGDALTEEGVIAGTMDIDFKSRVQKDTTGKFAEGSAALGVADEYNFSLRVAKTTEFAGKITRQPNIYSKMLRKLEQGASIAFDVTLSVLNPADMKQKKAVGKWVGKVPIDTASGAYELTGGAKDDRALRMQVDTVGAAKGFVDLFAGRLMGKAEKKESLAAYTYTRLVAGRTVKIEVKRSDPMRFDNIELAKGPAEIYPRTRVSGRLDYDYETGNWYTDGIRFKYALDGKDYEDVVSGSIKWVEDPNRKANGKGQYEFNLRFNEDKNKSAKSESAAFEKMSAEDAFFIVDDTIPCMTGTVAYVDTFALGTETPATSKVTFNLNANKLTKQQVMNFFKLWMVCVGPTNDE